MPFNQDLPSSHGLNTQRNITNRHSNRTQPQPDKPTINLDDLLTGTEDNNLLNGKAGNDTLVGLGGNDTLIGGSGKDSLDGGNGDDSLLGGVGADTLNAGAGEDTLDGGLGNDRLNPEGSTETTIIGGGGSDTIDFGTTDGENFAVTIDSGSGGHATYEDGDVTFSSVETLIVPEDTYNSFSINSGMGNITITTSGLENQFRCLGNDLGAGIRFNSSGGSDDEVWVQDLDATGLLITLSSNKAGTIIEGASTLRFTGVTNIVGGLGADTYTGSSGNDYFSGSSGNDSMRGLAGNDSLFGGNGVDTMIGGLGDDAYEVNSSSDITTEASGEGTDLIYVNASGSYTIADNVEDLTYSGSSDNIYTITGNASGNSINVANNNDTVLGLGGNDSINGNSGNDSLDGGSGNDTLNGGLGNDTLIGGQDDDRYSVSGGNQGTDTITDSAGTSDSLRFGTIPVGQATFTNSGDDLVITLTGGGKVTIVDYFDGSTSVQGSGCVENILFDGSMTEHDFSDIQGLLI